MAESVAAVIEVKSDLSSQWDDVERTAREVKQLCRPLRRDLNPSVPPGRGYPDPIPVFAVGYKGWSKLETVKEHFGHENLVNGILVIESGLFAAHHIWPYRRPGFDETRVSYAMWNVQGAMASGVSYARFSK